MLTKLSTMAPKNADQNPETMNPGTRYDANCNIKALMTSKNSPKVIMVSGSVTILSTNPRVALIRPITSDARRAEPKPRT